jgi:hypothetical protein
LPFELRYTRSANKQFLDLQTKDATKHCKVVKCLRSLAENPRHPGLNSHRYESMAGPNGEEILESYVENRVPAAWRVFWSYGLDERDPDSAVVKIITVVAITPHP